MGVALSRAKYYFSGPFFLDHPTTWVNTYFGRWTTRPSKKADPYPIFKGILHSTCNQTLPWFTRQTRSCSALVSTLTSTRFNLDLVEHIFLFLSYSFFFFFVVVALSMIFPVCFAGKFNWVFPVSLFPHLQVSIFNTTICLSFWVMGLWKVRGKFVSALVKAFGHAPDYG